VRIVVIATAASSGGALTILESLANHVVRTPGQHEWLFLTSVAHLPTSEQVRVRVIEKRGWLTRLAFEVLGAKRFLHQEDPDLVISLQNTLPRGIRCRQVLYLHQPIPFQSSRRFSFFKRAEAPLAVYQHLISRLIFGSVRRADVTVVQTRWMRDAVLERGLSAPDRIVTVPPSAADLNLPAARTETPLDRRHFLYPTSAVGYKNNETVTGACALLAASGHDFLLSLTVEGSSTQPGVAFVGQVSHEEIIARLSAATLVFASQVETFGLPLLEARSLGSVVLAADAVYAHEVLEGYENAHFFDPEDPAALAELMKEVLSGQIERQQGATTVSISDGKSGWTEFIRVATEA